MDVFLYWCLPHRRSVLFVNVLIGKLGSEKQALFISEQPERQNLALRLFNTRYLLVFCTGINLFLGSSLLHSKKLDWMHVTVGETGKYLPNSLGKCPPERLHLHFGGQLLDTL